jgi:hypothetical protein
MRKLSFLDSAFLLAESRETPMHVGSVNLFTLPSRADSSTFLHELSDQLKSGKNFQPIFGDKPRRGALGSMYWEPDKNLDINYHIRHSALPAPGRYRELFTLVSRLHATLLDRNRPLWEMHLTPPAPVRECTIHRCPWRRWSVTGNHWNGRRFHPRMRRYATWPTGSRPPMTAVSTSPAP